MLGKVGKASASIQESFVRKRVGIRYGEGAEQGTKSRGIST